MWWVPCSSCVELRENVCGLPAILIWTEVGAGRTKQWALSSPVASSYCLEGAEKAEVTHRLNLCNQTASGSCGGLLSLEVRVEMCVRGVVKGPH